jgi:hypothetical protein
MKGESSEDNHILCNEELRDLRTSPGMPIVQQYNLGGGDGLGNEIEQ